METESNKRKFAKQITCEQKSLFSTSWLAKQQRTKKHEFYETEIPYSYQSPSQSQNICVPQTCHIHQNCRGPRAEEFVLLLSAFPEMEQAAINTAIRWFWLCLLTTSR